MESPELPQIMAEEPVLFRSSTRYVAPGTPNLLSLGHSVFLGL